MKSVQRRNICVGKLYGQVRVGKNTIIHPEAEIRAEGGPIIIGDGNLIEERVVIVNKLDRKRGPSAMTIGNNNVFEVGCFVESTQIGDDNVIESKAKVGKNTILTNGCVIGAKCEVSCCETIPERTVIYGSGCERSLLKEKPPSERLQLDTLSVILPNFHRYRIVR